MNFFLNVFKLYIIISNVQQYLKSSVQLNANQSLYSTFIVKLCYFMFVCALLFSYTLPKNPYLQVFKLIFLCVTCLPLIFAFQVKNVYLFSALRSLDDNQIINFNSLLYFGQTSIKMF